MKLLRALVPSEFRSPRDAPLRRYFYCNLLFCVGGGLTLSLYVVYLHNVRGFSTSFSTLLLAGSALAAVASNPVLGSMTDRFGPLRVLLTSFFFEAVALVWWAFARTRPEAVGAALLLAAFGGAGWATGNTLLSRLVDEERRQRAFGFNFMLVNLGVGVGALVSASIVDLHHPRTFTLLYLIDAFVTVLAGTFCWTLRSYGGPIAEHRDDPIKSGEGWREVLRDRRLLMLVFATFVLLIGGYGSTEAGFSLFVVNDLKLSVHVLGVIFFFNTCTIVLTQLWILKLSERRSRTRMMAVTAGLWCVFWLILAAALALPAVLAVISLSIAMIVFAVGETLLTPVSSSLVNDIAPEHLRGRYNAAQGLAWGLSGSVAPVITALYFGHHLGNWWPLSTGLTALCGGFLMLLVRRHLSASEDGRVATD